MKKILFISIAVLAFISLLNSNLSIKGNSNKFKTSILLTKALADGETDIQFPPICWPPLPLPDSSDVKLIRCNPLPE
jgi:hypothetical protein